MVLRVDDLNDWKMIGSIFVITGKASFEIERYPLQILNKAPRWSWALNFEKSEINHPKVNKNSMFCF